MIDTKRLKDSFELVGGFGDEVPMFFYSHLFLCHPETRTMFPVSMMQQRDRLIGALGHIVSRVDDLDDLVPFLQQLGRDHRKFGTLAAHYPAVGASLLATLEHFAGDAWTPELAADWAAAYGLVAQVMTESADEGADDPAWWDAKVVAHERRTMDHAVIRLQPQAPLPYRPGQSISVETQLRPRLWRYYSPATAPQPDGTLEIHVQALDGGPVSSALVRHLGVGDIVRLGPAVGGMTLDAESDRDLLLVAGGVGLAPLKAILEQAVELGVPRRTDLFVAARTAADLYDTEDLARLAEQHPWLTVVPVVSEDDTEFTGERGSVADVVVRRGPWASRDVYVCGSPRMVAETRARLLDSRVPQQRIRCEEFATGWAGSTVEGGPLR